MKLSPLDRMDVRFSYLMVTANDALGEHWWSNLELPEYLPAETFWAVLALHVKTVTEEMLRHGCLLSDLQWEVHQDLMTLREKLESD